MRSYRTIVQLIAATTTDTGLKVRAELDENKYPKGVKVSDAQLATVNLSRHSFHGDWTTRLHQTEKFLAKHRIDCFIYGQALRTRGAFQHKRIRRLPLRYAKWSAFEGRYIRRAI